MKENDVVELFSQGFDCGQVVLGEMSSKLEIDIETARRMSACFGAGMFDGDTCGAITAAYMALGLKYGHDKPFDGDSKVENMMKLTQFKDEFLHNHNSLICRDLLGYDITNPDDSEKISEKNLLMTFCPKLVVEVIEILDNIL
ncbi:MAG: C-GCAxxG-C-C family protein [Clostridioides sp.]|nr:C-GCAxxG-C-C family protein [Clostridioides sp.]